MRWWSVEAFYHTITPHTACSRLHIPHDHQLHPKYYLWPLPWYSCLVVPMHVEDQLKTLHTRKKQECNSHRKAGQHNTLTDQATLPCRASRSSQWQCFPATTLSLRDVPTALLVAAVKLLLHCVKAVEREAGHWILCDDVLNSVNTTLRM